MRENVCARFKYNERDVGATAKASAKTSPSVAVASATPVVVAPSDHAGASIESTSTTSEKSKAKSNARADASPPRELLRERLREYTHMLSMQQRGSSSSAASTSCTSVRDVCARIAQDVAPYSTLKLGSLALGNICAKLLAYVLVHNTSLRTLELGFNRITDRGAVQLANALEKNQSLERLYLSGNEIGPTGVTAIARALAVNTTLATLHLSGNNIGEDGAKALAEGLVQNRALRVLYIGTNGIGPQGVAHLMDALRANDTLEELTIGQNRIGREGAQHIASLLTSTTDRTLKLSTLELGKNDIDHVGAIALAQALSNHPHRLRNLYLDNNPLGDTGAHALGEMLAKNEQIRVLDMSYTQMSLIGLRELSVGLSYSNSLLCLLVDGHDWASTKYIRKNTALQGMQLSAKGANNFAASCIAGAMNSNSSAILAKLTGVDLSLVLPSLTLPPKQRDELVRIIQQSTDPKGSERPKIMDLVTRNERILKFLREHRPTTGAKQKRKHEEPDENHGEQALKPPQLQRQKTGEEPKPTLHIDTSLAGRQSTSTQVAVSTPVESRLTLKSPRYDVTLEDHVRKAILDIARLPFNQTELDTLVEYYMVAQPSTPRERQAQATNSASTPFNRLARYPQTLVSDRLTDVKPL